jgi:hypothetical protein
VTPPAWGTPAWAGSDAFATAGDFTLSQPLVFVGRNLSPQWAAAVDLDLPAAPTGLAGRPGAGTYQEMTSRQRYAYLQWLANKRATPLSDDSTLRVFLAGLEGFLLTDGRTLESPDVPEVLQELQRLHKRYISTHGQLADQCSALHDAFRLSQTEQRGLRAYGDTGFVQLPGGAPSLGLRTALGHLMEDGKRLPARWAYQWARCWLSTQEVHVLPFYEDVLKRLFVQRYVQTFGEGLALPPTDRGMFEVAYVPRNPALRNNKLSLKHPVPSIGYWPHVTQPLAALLTRCRDELMPYALKRANGAPDAECWPQLPISLWPEEHRHAFRSLVEQALETPLVTAYAKLAAYFQLPAAAHRKYFAQLKARLCEFGLAAYPDLEGDRRPKSAEGAFVIFADAGGADALVDAEASTLEFVLRLCWTQFGASVDNWARCAPHLSQCAQISSLSRALRMQRRARLAWAPHAGYKRVTGASFVKLDPAIQAQVRSWMYRLLAHVADLGPTPLLDKVLGANWRHIPQSTEFVLDTAKVALLTHETSQVQVLLGTVFGDDMEPDEPTTVPSGAAPDSTRSPLRAFLDALKAQPRWAHSELVSLANGLSLMLDGTIDDVNELGFDQCGVPVLEDTGEDWQVDSGVLNEVLQSLLGE